MLPSYLTQTVVDIQRLTADLDGRQSTYGTLYTDVPCYMRELDAEESAKNNVQFGTGFFLMFDGEVDIQRGDMLYHNEREKLFGVEGVTYHPQGKTLSAFKQAVARAETDTS